ncbi:MAG: TOBE domain-containing protein, partial [Caldimonas sp.]
RPEHVELGSGTGDAASWPLRVQALEMLGAERLVYGLIGDSLFTVRLDATLAHPAPGDVVHLHASPEHLHWFDAETSARVEA